MPFIYESSTKQGLESACTNSSANTESDFLFLKPGASRALLVVAVRVQGKAGALTALSGISIRLKQWTATTSQTTSSPAGNGATTPGVKNNLAPACVATAGMATTTTGVVSSGTTGVYVGLASMGASGPGGWVAINPDDVPVLDGGANKSMDLVSASPTVSLFFEAVVDHQEG